jgi:ribosome maturation factor RimP
VYRDIEKQLLEAIEPVVRGHALELVDAIVRRGRGRGLLRIVVDTPDGDGRVRLDECAAVSREVGHTLDALDLIPGSYTLEVTSPGIDRTLGREIDFERAVGREVAVETRDPIEGRRRFRGRLAGFANDRALVEVDAHAVSIPFEAIARARAFYPLDVMKRGGGHGA